jgi:signal transduction histidine kinase/ligand-binding sensor domain-containing protein
VAKALRPIPLALAALLVGLPASALDPNHALTQYVHRVWQNQQGIPFGSIQGLWQTRDGYLWLGTQSGLIRFDGVEFRTGESLYPKLPRNIWVRGSGYEDAQGVQWIPTNDQGVLRVSTTGVTQYDVKQGLPSNLAQCVVGGRDGQMWVCTDQGLARIDVAHESGPHGAPVPVEIHKFGPETTGGAGNVRAACLAPDGSVWSGGDSSKLTRWNGSAFETYKLTSAPADVSVFALQCSDGAIWAGTSAGLIHLSGNRTERLYTVKDGLVDDQVFALAPGREGTLWIGTRNGFSRFRAGDFNAYRPEDGLSQSTVFAVYEDREGWLWVGTKQGLNQFVDGRALPFTQREGLPSNNAGPLLVDRGGTVWVGSLDKGLARYDGHKFTVLDTRNGLASDSVLALAEDAAGAIWAGTDRGLNRVEDGRVTATFTRAQGLPGNSIRAIHRASDGGLWVGTEAGLASFEQGRFVSMVSSPPGAVRAMGEDSHGNMMVATEHGVFVRNGQAGFREVQQNGFPIRDVDTFYLDSDGLLWMGTLGSGLRVLDKNGKLTAISMADGLFDGEIFGILTDAQDHFWMACSRGLFSVSRPELLRFAAGELHRVSSSPYSPTDGQQRVIEGRSGVQPALWRMKDGIMWFSTTHGLIVLEPNRQKSVGPLPVVIEDPLVNGKVEKPAEISRDAPGQKNLEIYYSALSFYAANRTTFRYQLEGFDKDWIDAGVRRAAFYTNLPPGTFHFRVTACTVDGLCNETGSSIDFTLASHYYQRPWFWGVVVVALAVMVWLGYQVRIRQLREKYDVILAERSRIARELHDTLIQGFSGITMALQALAGRVKSDEERATLTDIISDAARCLRETRQSVAGLRSGGGSRSSLANALEDAAREIAGAKDVRLRFHLDQQLRVLPAEVQYNLLRIAREAITNAVKHSGARTIEVVLESYPDGLNLRVKDDGTGFTRDSNGASNGGPGGGAAGTLGGTLGHYGLIGMKERAAQIGADIDLSSQPGSGTTVTVHLPVRERVLADAAK